MRQATAVQAVRADSAVESVESRPCVFGIVYRVVADVAADWWLDYQCFTSNCASAGFSSPASTNYVPFSISWNRCVQRRLSVGRSIDVEWRVAAKKKNIFAAWYEIGLMRITRECCENEPVSHAFAGIFRGALTRRNLIAAVLAIRYEN
jgi:hypothetical protein